MSYEVSAVEGASAPAQSSPVMREERILSPYQIREGKVTIGQYDKIERPAPEESRPTEESVRLSPGAAALARKELKFRQQQQALEKEKASVAAERAELAQLRAMKEKLAAKDYSGVDGLVDYNEYSQYQLNKMQGADPRAEELNQLKGKTESLEKMMQDNIETQFNAAVAERRIATSELVDKSDQFPAIKRAEAKGGKAKEAVVQHILDTWEHDSKELTIEQAAKEVETVLLEEARKWSALLQDEQATPEDPKKSLPPLKPSLRTLTNQVTSGQMSPRKSLASLSETERYAEARRRAIERLQTR
jgi:hypothetical protein